MGIILKTARTATLALALLGGAQGSDLEKQVERQPAISAVPEDKSIYVMIEGRRHRQRPPRECCDSNLYGPVDDAPAQKPVPGALYLGFMLVGAAIAGYTARKKQDEVIEKYRPQRRWNFFGEKDF